MYRSLVEGTGHYKCYKPALHTIKPDQYSKAVNNGKKLAWKKKSKKRMVLIGLYLHACQDRYAHGLRTEKIKHLGKTDDYRYDYTGKIYKSRSSHITPKFKKVSQWKKNNRLRKTVEATKSYLQVVKKRLNSKRKGSVKRAKNVDEIVTKFFDE